MIPTTYIRSLRREGKTLKQIGRSLKPPITIERVRQILNPLPKVFCKKHERLYAHHCRYCTIEIGYKTIIDRIIKHGLEQECERLSVKNRSKDLIIQRKILVKKLRDELEMSFHQIGVLLKRDHTTAMNLYYND